MRTANKLSSNGGVSSDFVAKDTGELRYSPATSGVSTLLFVAILFALTFVVNAMPGTDSGSDSDALGVLSFAAAAAAVGGVMALKRGRDRPKKVSKEAEEAAKLACDAIISGRAASQKAKTSPDCLCHTN